MAAQVEVQTGEVGRTMAGGRLHLNPLTDSSNKGLVEINQSHIITPEPNKPVPGPKPRLTPKPYAVDRNPTIKPILAPKPQTKPRPESTRFVGYKPEPPRIPKPQQPVATVKPRPVSFNPNRPASTSFKTSNQVNTGQTTKPVVQPFKPAPPFDPGDPSKPTPPVPAERRKSGASSLGYSNSLKNLPAAEWSGTTKMEDEKDKTTSSKGGASITRAKSMGFLAQVGQEEEEKGKVKAEGAVPLRPQPRSSRPRPVSAIFLDSPTNTEAPGSSPRWVGRRPLSADLTSRFESIGLSLHRKSPKANTKENTPEATVLPQSREQERTPKSNTLQSADVVAKPALSDQSNKETEEMAAKESDENKRVVSIKSRISLLLDPSSTPGTVAAVQGSDLQSPVQLAPEKEPPVGVKKLIKQLTEDTPPTQGPIVKPTLRPRPLPLDLTKRFSSEWSPDFGSVPLSEATDHHDITKDAQRRNEELTPKPIDHRTFVDLKDSQEQLQKAAPPEGPEAGHASGATSEESGPSGEVQTVRASLFENVVERHSVQMVDEDKPVNKPKDLLRSLSFKRGSGEDEGTLVTATYKDPSSPPSPLRVSHAVDTVQAVEENRAVSENVPSAQWEDKAATLRSRRSEGSRRAVEGTGSAKAEPTLAVAPEPQTRYLRVGALPKWTTAGHGQDAGVDKGPKRLKMLQAEEQQKPRATYFALTGQMQEPVSPIDAGAHMGDTLGPFDDFSVRAALGGSQGKILPVRRNPSLDEAFGKNAQDQSEEQMRSHMALEQEMLRLKELDRERERQREMEKAREKEMEREKQRELERQRQLDAERQELENQRSRQQEKERQRREELVRLMEMERRRLLEFEKQKQAEKDRQQLLEFEKRRLKEKLEREEADKMRQVAKQQEAERQRLKEKQKKEEQDRARSESSPLRPKVLDLDSVLRNEPFPKAASQRSDLATRWKEPSPRVEESYKPAILDIDAFTSQTQSSPSRDLVSGIQGVEAGFGARLLPTPEREISWKVPSHTSVGFSSPVWTQSPQDPWELRPVEMSVDKPVAETRKPSHILSPEQLLLRQGERLLSPQRHWSAPVDDPIHPAPFPSIDAKPGGAPGAVESSAPADQMWSLSEAQPHDSRGEVWSQRRSQGSQVSQTYSQLFQRVLKSELNRMRSRSVSRRSAPSSSSVETSLSRMRSRSAHRERDRHSSVQQKQNLSGEEEGDDDDSETRVRDTDSQYGTWETGLRTDDSLTPATPSSESNLSPSPRKHTPPHTPADHPSQFDSDALDGLLPRPSSDSQPLSFPEAPTALLDTSALRSRAQLVKKRAPRTRPTRAARQSAALPEGGDGTTEDWLYRDSTEAKVEGKEDDWDPEGQTRGAPPAAASQPQRVALFPGMDPSALKAQLRKRGDSDNQSNGPTPSPSQLSRSPKSPFLPRAARVLPPPGGKENGEEDSPQWLKELKSKKRLSQYENDS
ncbi:putative microtubule-associated protein futsch-like [Scophthalmus maximus]|uniref:Putative microtubule-associated protein futsch-like n=1 Tax=Scophthalmus maximus TaxID=52904 RepID=A0A2U9BQQ2_SCOMX|nr:putative microtubule-associated protein futsch-like [Scophthalmus maximus]